MEWRYWDRNLVERRVGKNAKTENNKNSYVNIYIIDDGIGIKEDVIQHIFDPFYTTKKNIDGTGLGLSVVYGIINKYNGSIKVKSKEGKGTTIKMTLPVCNN